MKFKFSQEIEDGETVDVEYSVLCGERYEILGILTGAGEIEKVKSPGLFFTEAEAMEWCAWLAKNKVLPSSLNQILSDELYIYQT